MEQGGSKRGEKWQDLDILKIELARLGRWTKIKKSRKAVFVGMVIPFTEMGEN